MKKRTWVFGLALSVQVSVAAEWHRCEVDGVATYSEAPCAEHRPVAGPAALPAPREDPREGCRAAVRFARQVADSRAAGVTRDVVLRATQAANGPWVAIVERIYAVPDAVPAGVEAELARLGRECERQK